MDFGLEYRAEDEVFWTFKFIISRLPLRRESVIKWMDRHPPLVFALLKQYPPTPDSLLLPRTWGSPNQRQGCFTRLNGHYLTGIEVVVGLSQWTRLTVFNLSRSQERIIMLSAKVASNYVVE